jgi:hypothetical protein
VLVGRERERKIGARGNYGGREVEVGREEGCACRRQSDDQISL